MTMLESALAYVAEGFKIFPCKLDKKPYTKNGLKDATQTQAGVKEYWTKWPDAGIGLVTDNLVVIDFDKKNGGKESKAAMETEYGKLPPTRTHRTGGGGLHYIYRNPNGSNIRNSAGLSGYKGVDIRANGGYIVVPPSPHESGKPYTVLDKSEIASCPDWLMNMAKQRSVTAQATPGVEGTIPDGQRNATLTSLAGTMRRRGMPQAAIEAALLEVNRQQCNPPIPDSEVIAIAESVSRYAPETDKSDITDKTDKSDEIDKNCTTLTSQTDVNQGKAIWRAVDTWLTNHKDERFDLDTICRHLDYKTAIQRHHVAKKLSYEVSQGNFEKSDRLYRYIDNTYTRIDWQKASESEVLAVKWPYGRDDDSRFGFDGHLVVSPGDIIVIAGNSNAGKTNFCINFVWENMDSHHCVLMGNEYEAGKFKRRVRRMDWANPLKEDGTPKFELIHRRKDWKDIIFPDSINIIDWISLADSFYKIGDIIDGIQSKLRNGIALISLQKEEEKKLGRGGGFSRDLASFYFAIDFGRLTVIKAKEWIDHDPNFESYGFEIIDRGTKFHNIRPVKKCTNCGGYGKVKGSQCSQCFGSGYVDK